MDVARDTLNQAFFFQRHQPMGGNGSLWPANREEMSGPVIGEGHLNTSTRTSGQTNKRAQSHETKTLT